MIILCDELQGNSRLDLISHLRQSATKQALTQAAIHTLDLRIDISFINTQRIVVDQLILQLIVG